MARVTLDPKLDIVFKLLFAAERNRGILRSFLMAVLKPPSPIDVLTINNPTIPGSDQLKRQVILDVHVVLRDGQHIDVEMQARRHGGPRPRWLFNWGAVFTDQLDSGHEFAQLKPVVCIIIMDFLEFQSPRFHSTFRVLEVHTHEEFSQHLEIHTLELPKLHQVTADADGDAVLIWGRFFAAETDEELEQLAMNHPEIAPATIALETLSQDPAARELARQRRLAELDYLSGIDEARAEGKAEGKAEGLRDAIRQLCHLLKIELDVDQQQRLACSSIEELLELQEALFKDRRWPDR
ncbi:MAG TPA: Rpn family recombination-promoting nuclease/putative transposase [Polyangiaceae bacterium]